MPFSHLEEHKRLVPKWDSFLWTPDVGLALVWLRLWWEWLLGGGCKGRICADNSALPQFWLMLQRTLG